MQQALYNDAVSASGNAHRVTINSRRINDATVAPALTKRNIAFSLNMFVNACNNITTTLQNIIR